MALTSSVGPITSSCPAPVAASAGAMDARVAQPAAAELAVMGLTYNPDVAHGAF